MENTTILDIDAAEKRISSELDYLKVALKKTLEIVESKSIQFHRRADILEFQSRSLFNSIARIVFLLELLWDKEKED